MRDILMLLISLITAACSVCLYVLAVLYRAWAAVWSFGLTLFVFGIFAVCCSRGSSGRRRDAKES